MIGKMLSHYRLIQKIGEGGMGVVWKAEDTVLGRPVAVKVLPSELGLDAERRRLFLNEARLAASLSHAHIVQVHDLGREDDLDFIVMELVEGGPLSRLLHGRGLPHDKVASYGLQVAEGLARAHRKGLIHRDLKPGNLLVTPEDEVKIVDFGLATLVAGLESTLGSTASLLTRTSTTGEKHTSIAGTLPYMSPEQVRGEKLDARSDIFSLGTVLYEMTTGRRPFQGSTATDLAQEILRGRPTPVHELVPKVPLDLDRIIDKALAPRREDRYQTTDDMAVDLKRLARELDSGSSPSYDSLREVAGRRRLPTWASISGVAVLFASLALVFWRFGVQRDVPSGIPSSPQVTRLTAKGNVRSAAISPDGNYVAYVSADGGRNTLSLMQIATGSTVELVPAKEAGPWEPTFSPDGNWVYYVSAHDVYGVSRLFRIPTLGGSARKLYDDVDACASLSPDGRELVFMRMVQDIALATEVYIGDAEGAHSPRKLIREVGAIIVRPQWSPDGETIAVGVQQVTESRSLRLALLSARGGPLRYLEGTDFPWMRGHCWDPEGHGLYVASDQIFYVGLNDKTPRQLTTDVGTYTGVQVTRDGKNLVSVRTQSASNLWFVPMTGSASENLSRARQLTVGSGGILDPDFSPDGRSIVFASDASGSRHLWVTDADGGNLRQLTSGPGLEETPQWSPDGLRIAFASLRNDSTNIFVIDAVGTNQHQLTHDVSCREPDWRPDGRFIAFSSSLYSRSCILQVPAEGGPSVQLVAEGISYRPHWSPDGSQLLWVGFKEDQRTSIFVSSAAGSVLRKIQPDPFALPYCWNPRGDGYNGTPAGSANVFDYPLDGGTPRQLTAFPPDLQLFGWSWLADGSAIVCSRGTVSGDVVLLQGLR